MAKKPSGRMNDVVALQVPETDNTSVTTSVRKIDNGYVIDKSCYGGTKGYQSTQRFSAEKPTLVDSFDVPSGSSPDKGGEGSMMRAKEYMEKNR